MIIKYRYIEPDNIEAAEFNNIHDFLFKYPMYGQLISGGREKLNTKIRIDVLDYPATISIEVIQE